MRRSLKCFAFFLSTFQRISFPHLPWDGIKNRIQEALFSNLSTPPEEVLCPQGSRDFMRSASQHPARKMRNKSGTSMEQTFRVGTEQFASPRFRKTLDAHGFPAIRNRSFSTISQCVHSAKSCILSNYTSHEKLDFRHPYFPSFSDSRAPAHSVIFRKLPMCTFRQKLRPKQLRFS